MTLLSLILPVYNDEKYVHSTLNSIKRQSLNNSQYELIIVDDGSIDNTFKICSEFLQKNKDINGYIYTQSNKGVSAARNMGIEKATSKYVAFVDGDDILDSSYLEQTVSLFEKNKNIDLVSCLLTYDKAKLGKRNNLSDTRDLCLDMYNCMLSNTSKFNGYVTNKIFNLDLIKRHQIKFKEGITYWEDMLFVEQYLKKCTGAVVIINKYYYYHRTNENSVTLTDNPTKIAKNIYSKAIVAFKISQMASKTSRLYSAGVHIYCNLLVDYRILYCRNIITKDQYLELFNFIKVNLEDALCHITLKKKIKYYLAEFYHEGVKVYQKF